MTAATFCKVFRHIQVVKLSSYKTRIKVTIDVKNSILIFFPKNSALVDVSEKGNLDSNFILIIKCVEIYIFSYPIYT